MAEPQKRFSFTDAAAQQPTRQRFSFAQPNVEKQTYQDMFPTKQAVQRASSNLPRIEKERSVGRKIQDFVLQPRGFKDQDYRDTQELTLNSGRKVDVPVLPDTTFKERAVGGAKFLGETVLGLSELGAMAVRQIPGLGKIAGERGFTEGVGKFTQPSTQGEAVAMRSFDVAGFIPATVSRVSRLNKLSQAAENSLKNNPSGVRDKTLKFLRENPDQIKQGEVRLREIEGGRIVIEDGRHRLQAGAERGILPKIVDVTSEYTGKPSTKIKGIIRDIKAAPATKPKTVKPAQTSTPSRFSFSSLLGTPAARKGGYAGRVPQDFPGQRKVDSPNVSSVDNIISQPKIEQRFGENFAELKSADNIAAIRNRTRSPQSNAQSLEKAKELGYTAERVLRIPEGKALNAEEKLAVSGIVESERLALKTIEDRLKTLDPDTDDFNVLRNEAARQKVKVFQMMAVERGVAAEAGRALQAHKATITAIEKNENQLAKYLAKSSTPQETKDYIYRKIEEFDGTPNELNKLLRELDEATLLEKFVEYATAAKLWNPTTHAVNMLTATTRMFMQSPIHALSAAFDSVLSKLTGKQRERFLSDAFAEVQGQYVGWKHAGHEAAKALKDENYAFESRILQDFEVRGPAIKGRPGKNELSDQIANGFGKAVRIPFRMLGVEDMLIRQPSQMGALYTAINRKARMMGLKPQTKEWDDFVSETLNDPVGSQGVEFMEQVQDIADQNLFQESLHPTLKKVSNWREDVPALKLVVPFFRTIINLQKQALEFSALAPILPSARKALREGGGARSDVLAKMTLGTAATIPLMHHALEGNITMAAPTNPAERDAFYAEGKQPYSVRLGDSWYTYNRFSPFSEWFITSAALAKAYENDDEKTAAELTAHVFFSMTQNFFDKSFATGMHDLMEALADPERAGNWVENFATGATIPNFIPLAARVVDPVIRETDDLRDAYISKVPYLSKTLDPKRDVFGEPLSRPGNAIQKIVSPVIPSPIEIDMVREELDLIGYQMGFPGKTAGGFQMDDETYRIYQAASGKIIYKALSQMMQNPGYQNLSPRQRERAVDKIVRDTRELVKSQVAQEQLIMQEIKNELKNQGYSSDQADDLAVKTYEVIKRRQEGNQ
jgi:hypothetical protein